MAKKFNRAAAFAVSAFLLVSGSGMSALAAVETPEAGAVIDITKGAKKDTTYTSDGNFTINVADGDKTNVITANDITFDENGEISKINDGAKIKTDYTKDGKELSDVGFFRTAHIIEGRIVNTVITNNEDVSVPFAWELSEAVPQLSDAAISMGFFIQGVDKDYIKNIEVINPTAVPTEEPKDYNIIKSWKFDFGSAEDAAEGYTAVTADVNYTLNTGGEDQYGFIGTNSKDYKLSGGRIDGFVQQQGQVIELTSGGKTGLADGIGSTGADAWGNAGDKYYPVRFALKVQDDQYFRIKATVTTLDPAKPATASLYTERKHPLYTEKAIPAGGTVTTEFTIRTTPIYYQKSDPTGQIADGMVNVAVLGENTALAALEIDQIDTAPVLWVLGDSTVTDGGASLPYSPYPNYTGVGTGLTKYLPHNIAMVNEGEGGLAANDTAHFNMVKNRIKAGDYMYVEYGHNHKSDGVEGYKSYLDKYYNACKDAGATLILVGPIDRHNDSQYDSATNTWSSTLSGFSNAAKEYVDTKLAEGAEDIAFVDLNKPSLDWYTSLTEGGTVDGTYYSNNIRLTDYYFRIARGGSHSSVDGTHPNDAGAENLAYFFFSTADTDAYPALKPLMTEYTKESPTPVSQSVLDLGWAGNDAWPYYYVPSYDYPTVVKDVNYEEKTMTAYVQAEFENYASGVIDVYNADGTFDKQYVTTDHIDNTTGTGTNVLTLPDGITIADGQTTKIYIWSCYLDHEALIPEAEGGVRLSAYYTPSEVEAYLLPGEEGDIETFDYYGMTSLSEAGWTVGGSSGKNVDLGEDDGTTYANLISTGGSSSWYVMKAFSNLSGGTNASGKYLVDFNMKYNSGYGLSINFAKTIKSGSPFAEGEVNLMTVNSNGSVSASGTTVGTLNTGYWTNVHYVLDMDHGTATASIAGGDPVTVKVPSYASFDEPSVDTLANLVFNGGKGYKFDTQISNLTVAKLKSETSTTTLNVASDDASMGSVYIGTEGTTSATVATASAVSAKAVPANGYRFEGWFEGETLFSEEEEISIARLYRDLSLTAKFVLNTAPATVTVNYIDADGTALRDSTSITTVDDKQIYAGDEFTLTGDAYTAAYKTRNSNGLYDVYLYDSAKSDSFTITALSETNTINVVFSKLEGEYYEYEDFASVTDKWGITEGKSGNVVAENGALTLFKNAGTSFQSSDVKTFADNIQAARKITVSFDWKNNVESGKRRNSLLDLYDSNGEYIFSINGNGSNGVDYAVGAKAGSGTKVGASTATYRIALTIDFEAGTLSGSVTNLSTNAVTAIESTKIAAANLAKLQADYGYSAAPQSLDNFAIKAD